MKLFETSIHSCFCWYKKYKNKPRNAGVIIENKVALFMAHSVHLNRVHCCCCDEGGAGEDTGRCEACRGAGARLIHTDAFVSAPAGCRAETDKGPAAAC